MRCAQERGEVRGDNPETVGVTDIGLTHEDIHLGMPGGSTSSRSPGFSDLGVRMRDDGGEHDAADDDGPGRVPVNPEHGWPPLTSPCDLSQRSRISLALTSQRACYAFRLQTATGQLDLPWRAQRAGQEISAATRTGAGWRADFSTNSQDLKLAKARLLRCCYSVRLNLLACGGRPTT
jgi:hypothetical protein